MLKNNISEYTEAEFEKLIGLIVDVNSTESE